jgi:hypothetical protein
LQRGLERGRGHAPLGVGRGRRRAPVGRELREIERGAVAHLVVLVVQRAAEEHQHAGAQVGAALAVARERRHGGRAHGGVLQDDAVVDEPDVAGGVLGLGALAPQEVQDLHRQEGELAVLDELGELRQAGLLGLGHVADQRQHRVHDGALVLEPPVLAQHARQEGQQRAVLGGELDAQRAHRLHHHHLELVGQLRHEAADLLEQPLHRRLVARLEQGGDGQGGDGAVGVGDERLHVDVAPRHRQRVRHGHRVEGAHRGEAQHGLGGAQEELEDGHRGGELAGGDVAHAADGARRLEDDQLRLVAQARLQEVVVRARLGAGARLGGHLRHVAHQQELGHGRPHRAAGELRDQLVDGEAVGGAQRVLQRHRVELHHGVAVGDGLLHLAVPPLDDLRVGGRQLDGARQHRGRHHRRLVHHRLLQVALDLEQHLGVDDLAQHADGVGAVEVVGGVHVLHERGGDDDDLVRGGDELLDAQVDHAPQVDVLVLEELGHGEEHLRGLGLRAGRWAGGEAGGG